MFWCLLTRLLLDSWIHVNQLFITVLVLTSHALCWITVFDQISHFCCILFLFHLIPDRPQHYRTANPISSKLFNSTIHLQFIHHLKFSTYSSSIHRSPSSVQFIRPARLVFHEMTMTWFLGMMNHLSLSAICIMGATMIMIQYLCQCYGTFPLNLGYCKSSSFRRDFFGWIANFREDR